MVLRGKLRGRAGSRRAFAIYQHRDWIRHEIHGRVEIPFLVVAMQHTRLK